ncbi:serine/threonine-protein kinase [Nocardioides hwasunensis]|uniref:non-specific serine/threonine protein kinase n=1 Tax=Nocardioides hwasunensis TaxID=397258 RepID=A0ABR8MJJ0_9ACTN|nr:serine/threonine-protein kinase [Nocardioides hwasunensis]MBD3914910.1 serine/threonine protein kinase [Nocardioides hwasunensis]
MSIQQADPVVLAPGDEIAPGYTVVSLLSRGSALDVYEVWSEERLCSCVAKTIRPDRVDVRRVRCRLLQEGWLLKELAHPHLPRAFETIEGATPVVILETDVGLTLEEVIDERLRRLPVADLCHLGRQLASAISYLHDSGYLHLDVRPGNVMAHAGRATLIDLSIARPPGLVRRGTGTREYLAPEQARGEVVTTASDVWGLGATLFEAATGVAPFAPLDESEDDAFDDGAFLQLHRSAPRLGSLRTRLPRAFTDLLSACLAPEPVDRPSVRHVHDRLGDVLSALDA